LSTFCSSSSNVHVSNAHDFAAKALELFLQDLCDRTYDITIRKGVKTVGSSHL